MRLPFGLGRRSSSGDGASSDGSGAGSGAAFDAASARSDGAADRGGAPSPAPRAWASLPAIQRTAGEMPLVAAPGRFVQRLPGSTGLPPIVQPLGHEVSPLATPGLVVARLSAVEAPASVAIAAPVQRRASHALAAEVEAPAFATADHGARAAVEADAAAATAEPAPAAMPIRTMLTVSRQAVHLPESPLTSAVVAARPTTVQRTTSAATTHADAPALPRPSGGMRRVPSAAPAAPGVSREVAHSHATATPAAPPPQPAAGPNGAARHGLGEPMQSAPTTARPVAAVLPGPVVSRSTTSGPMPIAASNLRPVAQRPAEGGPESLPALRSGLPQPATDRGVGSAPPELLLPHLPVQRVADASSAAHMAAPAAAPATPSTSEPQIRPTAGANPIRPSIEIQRAASDDRDDHAPDDELPSPWWNPVAGTGSDPAQSNANGPGLGGGPAAARAASIQRSTAGAGTGPTIATISPHGVDRNRPAQAGRSAPVAPPVQRIVGSALRPSALPQPIGAGSRHGPTVAASVIESASVAPASSSGRVIGGGPVVQTSPAGSSAPAAPAPAVSSLGGPALVHREEAGAPAAPAPGGSGVPSERDLDELAQALFGRIRGRLRNDLIYDREAKGLTFDNV